MNPIVVKIENLAKRYRLGVIGYGTLQSDLQSLWARFRGKEDPNAPIGQDSRIGKRGEFWALRNLSFNIEQGARIGILGRNGAGKSTLLKILARTTAPTLGSVKIRGRIASLLEVGTGFSGELTGRENVFLSGAILGMRRREIQRKLDQIIDFSGISQFIDTPVKRYSSGMFVRLAFSVAAHLDTDILLLDEVLAVGDAEFQNQCIAKMEEVNASDGRTIVIVSHILSTIKRLCRTGLLLKDGKIETQGPIDQVLQEYNREYSPSKSGLLEMPVNTGTNYFIDRVIVQRWQVVDKSGQICTGRLYNSQNYFLEADIQVFKPDCLLSLLVSIYTLDGDLIFTSDIHRSSSAVFGFNQPGSRRIQVSLPRNLLASKTYNIEFSASLHGEGWVLPPGNNNRLQFDYVIDDFQHPFSLRSPTDSYDTASKPGYIDPVLDWRIVE